MWDMAFIEPMHRNKLNITYLLTHLWIGMINPSLKQDGAWNAHLINSFDISSRNKDFRDFILFY